MNKFIDPTFLKDIFRFKDSSRSDKAKKNIVILFFTSVFNFISIMALVPVTIDYLGEGEYGIWLTLSSILMWLINLDFGLGNGLRNKLAEAITLNDLKLAKTYVSTAYAIFGIGIVIILLVYYLIHPLLNWQFLLNAEDYSITQLNKIVLLVLILFSVNFWLKLLHSIINADQRPSINGVISLSINALTLIIIFILSKISERSLFLYGLTASSIPIIVFLISSLILYSGEFKRIAPSFKYVNFKYSSNLVKLGMQFFIIQMSALIIFTSDNMIITHLFGPEQVTVYNIAYKYFYLVPMVFNVIITPFWSAFTEAYVKKEEDWIKNIVKKLVIIWLLLSVVTILMIFISNLVYKFWVGSEIVVPLELSIACGVFVIIVNWNNIFTYFVNGVGKVKVQLYYAIVFGVLNIPLSIFLAKNLNYGITGVIAATNICLIFASVLIPLQYKKLIEGKAKGIWDE